MFVCVQLPLAFLVLICSHSVTAAVFILLLVCTLTLPQVWDLGSGKPVQRLERTHEDQAVMQLLVYDVSGGSFCRHVLSCAHCT